VLKPVAVAAQRNTFIDLFLDAAPAVAMVHHIGYVVIFLTNVMKFKKPVVIKTAVRAL
jgi:hypothetical protein